MIMQAHMSKPMIEFVVLRPEEISVNGVPSPDSPRAGVVVAVATVEEPVVVLRTVEASTDAEWEPLFGTAVLIVASTSYFLLTIARAIELTTKVRMNSTKPAAM